MTKLSSYGIFHLILKIANLYVTIILDAFIQIIRLQTNPILKIWSIDANSKGNKFPVFKISKFAAKNTKPPVSLL